jgi:hypothetical protein
MKVSFIMDVQMTLKVTVAARFHMRVLPTSQISLQHVWIYCFTRLQLNLDRTECIWIQCACCHYNNFSDLCVGGITAHPSTSAKSVCIYFDQFLSLEFQLSSVSESCYFQLCELRPIRKWLDRETVQTLLQAFVSNHLDYCGVLTGVYLLRN